MSSASKATKVPVGQKQKEIKQSKTSGKADKKHAKRTAIDHGKNKTTSNNGMVTQTASAAGLRAVNHQSQGKQELRKSWFLTEIQGMMYAFGDCRKPSPESAALVEMVVHQQMSALIVQAGDITNMRGGRFMSMDDILFLLKRDKAKLRRVIRYLAFKDLKSKVKQSGPEDEEIGDTTASDIGKCDNKRLKLAYDFISSIDNTGELVALFDEDDYVDEVKQERLERAEQLSRCLDHQSYMDFIEARQANFNKKAGRFKDWLDVSSLIDVKPSGAVMEILSYLAYETVSLIVDLALLVKRDEEKTDCVSFATPMPFNPISSEAKLCMSKTQTEQTISPSTPTVSSSSSNFTTTTTSSSVTSLTAPVQGGLAFSLGNASLASSCSLKQPKMKKKRVKGPSSSIDNQFDCIQPTHIREAIRRYNRPTGVTTPFQNFARPTLAQRTLCL